MHRVSNSFILGFHLCDHAVAKALLAGEAFQASENAYDWLGHDVCFWEANSDRGFEFARASAARPRSSFSRPLLVAAVLDLGLCLDMTTLGSIALVEEAYLSLKESVELSGKALPRNSKDMMRRDLDCAVITRLHEMLVSRDSPFDTVKGIFVEDDPIYESSGFHRSTHVQIAVRNPACIKGVFRVPRAHLAVFARETGMAV